MSTPPEPPEHDASSTPLPDSATPTSSLPSTAASSTPSGPRHAAKKQRRRFWPRKRWVQVVTVLGIVLALVIAGAGGYLYWQSTRIHHIEVKGLSKDLTGVNKGTENILMVGSTDRCALKVQNPIYGICSQGVTGVNSDVVLILHLDWNHTTMSILSIPRDTFIPNARSTGANKIDAALAEGPGQLVNAIQQDFGIPIQHYVELNFETFANVVDALGGVSMYFPMPVYDAYSQLKQYTTGCVHLNGTQALTVVRARHLQYQASPADGSNPANWPQENLSDLARIRRNHEFLRVLGAAVQKQGLGDPITDAKVVNAVAPNLVVDQGFSTSQMINMILHFHNINVGNVPQYTLPVMTSTSFSYVYQGYNYGNVTFPINNPDTQTIHAFLGTGFGDNTMTGGRLPLVKNVTVSVMNGSGTSGQAQATAEQLKAIGFQVGTVGDTTPVGNPAETVVAYNSLDPSVVAQAQTVMLFLSGQTIMAYEPTMTSPVTLVTGTSFTVAPPPSATPSTTTTTAKTSTTAKQGTKSSTTTSSTTTTVITVPGFAAPNSATSQLQPWDPRSCNAKGGAGP